MHYTGTIWRPPYEAYSLLIQVTAGCTVLIIHASSVLFMKTCLSSFECHRSKKLNQI